MKLNGALEPHQGASIQRSSTGVVAIASKYREQRYPYQNVDAVQDVTFTRNAVGVDKMQQQQQQEQQQQQSCASDVKIISKKLESSKATCSGSNDKSTNNNNKENNSNVNRFTNIDYNSHGNRGRRTHQKQIKQQIRTEQQQQTLIDVNIETRLLHQSLVNVVTLEASSRYSPSLQSAGKRVVIGNNLVRHPDSSQLSMFLWQTVIILWPFISTFDVSAKVIKVMRASRGFNSLRSRNIWPKNDKMLALCLLYAAAFTLPQVVLANDDDHFFGVNSFSMAPEATTTEFGEFVLFS